MGCAEESYTVRRVVIKAVGKREAEYRVSLQVVSFFISWSDKWQTMVDLEEAKA